MPRFPRYASGSPLRRLAVRGLWLIEPAYWKVRWLYKRSIGRLVCRVRGKHHYDYGGAWCSWKAYSCTSCGQWDRPLEDLPPSPSEEEYPFEHETWRDW